MSKRQFVVACSQFKMSYRALFVHGCRYYTTMMLKSFCFQILFFLMIMTVYILGLTGTSIFVVTLLR